MFFTSFMTLVLLCLKGSLIFFFPLRGVFSSSARPLLLLFFLFCFFQLATLTRQGAV